MCDPVSLALASTAIGVGGTAMNAVGQMSAQKKQQRNVADWQRQQNRAREAESARQEELRQQANQSREAGVQQISADEQAKRQAAEEERLTKYLQGTEGEQQPQQETGGAPVSVADARLTGQQGGDPVFQTDLAKKISEASAGAKQRLAALARVSSYGESFGGLGTTNPLIQQETGANIDKFNEFRRGSMGAYGLEKAIDPVQVSYTPSPLADIFSAVGNFGAQGLGSVAGSKAGGTTFPTGFPAAPKASTFIGAAKPAPTKFNYAGLF
jgi:hypothetical protein